LEAAAAPLRIVSLCFAFVPSLALALLAAAACLLACLLACCRLVAYLGAVGNQRCCCCCWLRWNDHPLAPSSVLLAWIDRWWECASERANEDAQQKYVGSQRRMAMALIELACLNIGTRCKKNARVQVSCDRTPATINNFTPSDRISTKSSPIPRANIQINLTSIK